MDQSDTRKANRVIQGASAMIMTFGLILSLVAFPLVSSASTGVYQPQSQAGQAVTVPAGGTATLTVRGFCLDFGKTFPTGAVTANGLGADNVRQALNYAIQKGYTDSNARQVELAIWNLSDNTWHADPHDIGTEIVTNATAANMPAQGTGTSLVDAMTQGTITGTATFIPQTADEFYGDGKLTLTNSGTSDMSVYLPVGVVFSDGNSANQRLLVYQLSAAAQVTGTVSATTSPEPSGTSVVTGTVSATGTVTSTETASPGASATSVVSGTTSPEATATVSGVGTTVTTATEVATSVATEVATSVATATEVATLAPTETATTAPVATDTPVATATTVPVVLPQTGGSDGSNGLAIAALLMGITLTLAGSGALVLSRRRA